MPRNPWSPGDPDATDEQRRPELPPTGKYIPAGRGPAAAEAEAAPEHALSSAPPAVPGYDVVGELGRGGAGVVYKAWHVPSKRFVALKMVLPGPRAAAGSLQRFRAEAEAAARLEHPNIVRVYEVGEQDGWPFIALEFCGGGTLAKKLAGTPLPARAAAELTEKLARAVAYAHERQVVHRDLKPANIMIGPDGEPKVSDFGLARQLDRDEAPAHAAALGTPSYMPPEQAEAGIAGPLADVYALGAILYEMLTGRPPFKGATPLDTIDQVRRQAPVPPRLLDGKIPAGLDAICLTCLRKEPARRYASAADLAADLRRFLDGRPVAARPAASEPVRRVRREFALVIGVLIGVLLIAAGVVVRGERERRAAEDAAKADREALAAEERRRDEAARERDRTIRLLLVRGTWEVILTKQFRQEIAGVGFSTDGRRVLVRFASGEAPRAWNVFSGEEVSGHVDEPPEQREAVSPDGRLVATAGGHVLQVRRAVDPPPKL
jgi:hypothetical protein